jgi:hypothetical protein
MEKINDSDLILELGEASQLTLGAPGRSWEVDRAGGRPIELR